MNIPILIWEKKEDCTLFKKKGFTHKNRKNEGIRIISLKKESQSESGINRAAQGIICNIIPQPKAGKTILILYSNKNMKWHT